MENRFAKIRELGSKGKRSNPLVLEEFVWENEWVEEDPDDNLWSAVDEVLGASQGLRGRNLPRAAATAGAGSSSQVQTFARTRKRQRNAPAAVQDISEEDDNAAAAEDDNAAPAVPDDDESESSGGGAAAAADGFQLDQDLV